MGVRGELQLLEMAVKRRFNIDRDKAANTVNRLLDSKDERIQARAASIAAMMESQNQKDEHKVIDVHVSARIHRLDELAADLGIEIGAIENATRSAGGGDSGTEATGFPSVDK